MTIDRENLQTLAKLFGTSIRSPAGPPGTGAPAVSANYFLHQSSAIARAAPNAKGSIGKPTGTMRRKFYEKGGGFHALKQAQHGIQPAKPQLLPSPGAQQLPLQK